MEELLAFSNYCKLVHLITLSKYEQAFFNEYISDLTPYYLFYLFQVCQSKIIIINLHCCENELRHYTV